MDDSLCLRALYSVRVYVGHYIMAYLALALFCHIIIDVVSVCLELIDLLLGNRQSQLLLCLCQSDPQSSPGAELHIRGKDILHLAARVPLGERAYISVCTHSFCSPLLFHDSRFKQQALDTVSQVFLFFTRKRNICKFLWFSSKNFPFYKQCL